MIMSSYKIFYLLFISCNVCYELCPFYQSEAASAPPTNTADSQGKGRISSGTTVAIVVPISVAVLILIVGLCCLCKRIRKKHDSLSAIGISKLDSLQYDFRTIEAATNNFSGDNMIGRGGFGDVYKGMLPNGQEIAAKRLSKTRSSRQGVELFKNEVEVHAKLQHRNLVRLLGFSVRGEEKILVYEYMPNISLDRFLFDTEKQRQLDWTKRYKIVKGIVRAIQYIHDESRLKIIHRDIKPYNVLLDSNMSPKITDFGIASVCTVDQTEINIDVISGTRGYLAPENLRNGVLSAKCDVYSFGILLMEIICGGEITTLYQMEDDEFEHMLSRAWRLWEDGEALELVDPTIRESCNPNEAMRCIHIALLCVQIDPTDRPSMSSIILMLESYSLTLPSPSDPTSFHQESKEGEEYELSTSSMEDISECNGGGG